MSSSSALWLMLLTWGKLTVPVHVTFFFLQQLPFFIKDKTKLD